MLITAYDAHLLIKRHCCPITRHFYTANPNELVVNFAEDTSAVVTIYTDMNKNTVHYKNQEETCLKQTQTVKKRISMTMSRPQSSTDEFRSSTTDSEVSEERDPWIPITKKAKRRRNTVFEEMQDSRFCGTLR